MSAASAASPWPASRSCMLPLGSISMALRLSKPSTRRASLPNFWLKASLRLWAGSVEMSSTERRTLASWMARLHDVVVLPTPPLPPTKIHRSDRWSRMDWSVGSMASGSSVLMRAAEDMVAVVSKGRKGVELLRGELSRSGELVVFAIGWTWGGGVDWRLVGRVQMSE